LLEAPYRVAMSLELSACGLVVEQERTFPIIYREVKIGEYRPDLIVAKTVIVEIKSVERYDPVFAAQVLTYLRITDLRIGLLMNFNRPTLKEGLKRFSL
jgi:GxxExxY protein